MKTNKISLSIKISTLVMVTSLLGIASLAYISYTQAKTIFTNHSAQILAQNIDQYSNKIKSSIEKLKYNITIFTYNPSVKGFMRSYLNPYKYDEVTNKTFGQYQKDISTIITLMMKQNPAYFQMRIIDANSGEEIIKFVKEDNKIKSIAKNKLQNKWDMQYVQDTLKLNKNDMYLSKINLNKEFHTIELPIKPTIRIARIIYANNKKAGIMVINANIEKLFDFKLLKSLNTPTYIANKDGYYLFNYDNPDKMFGFEFGKDFTIFDDFPMIKKFFNSNKREFSFIDTKNDKIYEARKVYLTKDRYIVVLRVATTSIFKKQAENYTKNLILVILLITFIITLMTTFLVSKLTSPIKKLTNIAKDIADSKGKKHIDIDVKSNDEIGELAKAFEVMVNTLDESRKEIEDFANKLEIEVEKKTKELQEVNKNLQKLVEEKVNEVRDKDKVLVQQSKMAAMGEMIGAIAHQWRQPLNSLALNIQLLEDMVEDGECTQENIEKFVDKNMQTIQFMSQTIDDFRNFFRKDKEAVEFNIKEAILKTINLQKAQLNNHNIEIITNLIDAYIKGYKNEFMQIILNLISNAKDAILERREKIGDFEGKIEVYNKVLDDKIIVGIKDNGGGIPDEIKERIFEPYFTTKEEGKGTGMGLYMVKEMVERMKGKIEFRNVDDGVEFIISFNK